MKTLMAIGLASVLLVGCKKEEKAEAAPAASAVQTPPPAPKAPPAPVAAAAPAPSAADSAVPVEEDFEQKATASITASNAEQELKKVEAEIGH